MKWKILLLVVAVALLVLSFKFYHCSSPACTAKSVATAAVSSGAAMTIGPTTIHALIADTDATREQGLSDRDGLPPDTGMLFIFDQPGNYGFWMKDMRFDLDMIWVSADKKVLGVSAHVPANSYPKIFYPPSDAQYVIEVPAGFAAEHHIATGQQFSYVNSTKTPNGQ